MSAIFNPDNAFFRMMTKVCQGAVLSLLWLVCSLPLFTVGAATAALDSVMLQMVRDEEGYIVRGFLKAFARHFRRATAAWLLIVAASVLFWGDIVFFVRQGNRIGLLAAGLFFAAFLLVMLFMMTVFHCLAWFEDFQSGPLKLALSGGLRMALGYLPYSGSLLGLFFIMGYGIYVSVPLMFFFFFFGMGMFGYASAYLWRRVFDRLPAGIK